MNAINKYIKLRRKDLKPNGDHYSDGSLNFELNLLKVSVKVAGNGLKFNYITFNKFKKGEQESVILPHDIRRKRIIEMIEMGIDRTYIMAQTGHKSHRTFDRYNIPQENIMLKMVEGLRAKEEELRKQRVETVKNFERDYKDTKESIWTTL
jgi:hypothetical protein